MPSSRTVSKPVGQRVSVIGVSGSGKTTLARRLATAISAQYLELDELHHAPGWTTVDRETFRARVSNFLENHDQWVIDGNYRTRVQDLIWEQADTIIWLDYPLRIPLWRITKRSLQRGWKRQELWHGNRESLWTHLATRDSMILWTFRSHFRLRYYREMIEKQRQAGKLVHRFSKVQALEKWLAQIEAGD